MNFKNLLFESDRAAILICTTLLDNSMKELFDTFFLHANRNIRIRDNEIFTNNAPLSTFSSKIKLLYLLGIIPPVVYKDLEKLENYEIWQHMSPITLVFLRKR